MSSVLVAASISSTANSTLELSYSDNGANWGTSPVAQQSSAPVSLATFNNLLWAAFRGRTTSHVFVSSSANWGVNQQTGQSTQLTAPSLTVFNSKLWIAYIGESTGRVEVISSGNGSNWSQSTATGQSSKLGPSITVFNDKLWIAYVGQDTGHIEVIYSSDGSSWSKSTATGQSSKLAPSITVFNSKLWIAYIGADTGRLEVIYSGNGSSWSQSTATGQTGNLAPSITAFENRLWIAYIGEATGQVEVISSSDGSSWPQKFFTGQPSVIGPSLIAVPAVQPPSGLGGAVQYLLASPQHGWPSSSSPLPPIDQLLLWIQITEELTFDPSKPLSFQLNCCAPSTGNWKIGWQQYVLMMQPNSTEMFLHIQNFQRSGGLAVYAGDSPSQINFPNLGSIPAGWAFQLALQISSGVVTGASCVVSNASHETVGALQLNSIGLPLALQSGTVDQSWLAPVVIFQLVVVGFAEGTHTTFASGNGYVYVDCSTPLVAGNTWAGSDCAGGGGTAESSNCVYSVIADVTNGGVVQCFGAPPSV
jgi:hypothetical protein